MASLPNVIDGFVLTLSDADNPASENCGTDSDDENNGPKGKKRKRDQAETTAPGNKKQKRQQNGQQLKAEKNKTKSEQTSGPKIPLVINGNADALEDTKGDDALNPDFEFVVSGDVAQGIIEDFDGWEVHNEKMLNGAKKRVEIDDIIARRRIGKKEEEKKTKKQEAKQREQRSDNDTGLGEDGGDEGEGDFANFDDELLAPDGFGMGAPNEESDAGLSQSEEGSGSEVGFNKIEEDSKLSGEDDAVSGYDNSVASPVSHPDDLASNTDSESKDMDDEEQKRNAFFAPEEKSTKNTQTQPRSSFQAFNLSRPILRGLAAVGFMTPTPIQSKTIPVALMGKDIVGGAVTGSGKTAAFIIPILERLLYRPRKVPTSRVAVLMPTRELAIQCYNVATRLAAYTDITFCQLVGGFSLREQENVLKKRPDVIIATPGRFIDHMRNSTSFTIDTLEILVLDEADRMLEDGFADELNEILTTIPKSRQTMLFSATMTDSVDKLIRVGLNRPVRLLIDAKKQTVGTLVQEFVRLRPGREDKRLGYLLYLCTEIYTSRVIIFFRQKREAHRVRIVFGLSSLKAAELHGSMGQEQRIRSVEDFRDGRVAFLLATDVASRGLDIRGVETVINYEAPQTHEIYLHRVGRTARAGRSGRACTLAAESDRKVVKAAVKAGKSQGAKIVSRIVDPELIDKCAETVEGMADEIEEVLREEKEEKQLAQAEMQVTKGENLIKHEAEILSRPKRTWFESEREKQEARKRGLIELNGPNPVQTKGKRKLSGKEKKRLDSARERQEGKLWKKGKRERENQGTPKVKSIKKSVARPKARGKRQNRGKS